MSAEENKAVVRREIEELFNHTGNLDAADEVYAPDSTSATSLPSETYTARRPPSSTPPTSAKPSPTWRPP